MDRGAWVRSTLARVAAFTAIAAAVAAPAAAHGRAVSESAVRTLETQALGPAHALEHAIERRGEHRMLQRWRSLSPAGRARLIRRRLALHAASTAPSSEVGSWDSPFQLPVHAIHSAVLPTGKVMIWSYPFQATAGSPRLLETHAYLWDPSIGTGSDAFKEVSPPADGDAKHAMIFCGGGSLLADGRLLTTGGTLYWPDSDRPHWAGIKDVWTFDPWDETWTRQPDTARGRWYPTQTELPDGRTLILGGYDESGTPEYNPDLEVFRPSADPHGVGQVKLYPSGERDVGTYPHVFTMPNGKVLLAGPRSYDSALLTVTKPGPDGKPVDAFTWDDVENSSWRTQSNAVLEPGGPTGSTRVTLIGGTDPPAPGDPPVTHVPARETTQTFDVAHLADGWTPGASMQIPRSNFNTVTLPDRSLVAFGGSNGTSESEGLYATWPDNRSRQVDIRDPATGTWQLGPAQQEDRAYHSTAVLLPDGRVLSGGDDRASMRFSDTGEIYSPAYLFRGPRPLIGAAPTELGYGRGFRVGSGSDATEAVLMAPGVTTHGTEMQARYVQLAVTHRDSTGLDLVAPVSGAVAPPGWYMLFLLNSKGVPSVARWVHLDLRAAPGFGTAARVSIVDGKLHLHRRAVTVRLANANGFAVPAQAYLRLTGKTARNTHRATAKALLPAGGTKSIVIGLGKHRASLVRRAGRLHAAIRVVLRDPRGNLRTVKRTVDVVPQRP
jgi:hypothetical protein